MKNETGIDEKTPEKKKIDRKKMDNFSLRCKIEL